VKLGATVLIDEKRRRSVAEGLSLKILGTAGLFLIAYQRGLITDLEECFQGMKRQGYRLSERLIESILQHAASVKNPE